MNVSEEYETLYHYTTLEGLTGILEHRCLWATHYRYLNDSSEALLMKDKLIETVHSNYRSRVSKLLGMYSTQREDNASDRS